MISLAQVVAAMAAGALTAFAFMGVFRLHAPQRTPEPEGRDGATGAADGTANRSEAIDDAVQLAVETYDLIRDHARAPDQRLVPAPGERLEGTARRRGHLKLLTFSASAPLLIGFAGEIWRTLRGRMAGAAVGAVTVSAVTVVTVTPWAADEIPPPAPVQTVSTPPALASPSRLVVNPLPTGSVGSDAAQERSSGPVSSTSPAQVMPSASSVATSAPLPSAAESSGLVSAVPGTPTPSASGNLSAGPTENPADEPPAKTRPGSSHRPSSRGERLSPHAVTPSTQPAGPRATPTAAGRVR